MSRTLVCFFFVGVSFVVAPLLAEGAASRHRLSAAVDETIHQQMEEQRIPGLSLAVVRDGRIIRAQGYGMANIESGAPVTPATIFEIGSLTKQFTATAIMSLAEAGKLSLDDSIVKFFPEAPPAMEAVTIRHLLTHTSGINDVDGDVDPSQAASQTGTGSIDVYRGYTEDGLVRAILAQPLNSPPGTKWSYCNACYVLMGFLIHRVTGMPYEDFLGKRIFAPLGMGTARMLSYAAIVTNRSVGYDLVDGAWRNAPRWKSESISDAAGGLLMSVLDLAKWDASLYTERIVKRGSLEAMWAPVPLDDGSKYPGGMGWFIANSDGHRIVFHTGSGPGFCVAMSRYLKDRLTIIVLTNVCHNDSDVVKIVGKVAETYLPDTKGSNPIKDW
jgi:CubicO group peptidase (beta-lactamase class C family)